MSRPSIAQQLDRLNTSPTSTTGEHFYDRLPAEPFAAPTSSDQPDPRIVSPWDKGTRAERELRYRFSEADAELGERSAHESLVYRIQVGGGESSASLVTDPFLDMPTARLPSARQVLAAERVARIDKALAQLVREHYAVLELSFSLRKPNPQIRGLLASSNREHLEPVITYLYRTGQVTFRIDGKGGAELEQVITVASKLRADALAAYEVAAGIAQPAPKRTPKARAALVPVGSKGASKRRLVPMLVPTGRAA